MNHEKLFFDLYEARDEEEVQEVIDRYPKLFGDQNNWKPVGNNKSNFSIVKNQRSNSIVVLIEKFTNSIDTSLPKI